MKDQHLTGHAIPQLCVMDGRIFLRDMRLSVHSLPLIFMWLPIKPSDSKHNTPHQNPCRLRKCTPPSCYKACKALRFLAWSLDLLQHNDTIIWVSDRSSYRALGDGCLDCAEQGWLVLFRFLLTNSLRVRPQTWQSRKMVRPRRQKKSHSSHIGFESEVVEHISEVP